MPLVWRFQCFHNNLYMPQIETASNYLVLRVQITCWVFIKASGCLQYVVLSHAMTAGWRRLKLIVLLMKFNQISFKFYQKRQRSLLKAKPETKFIEHTNKKKGNLQIMSSVLILFLISYRSAHPHYHSLRASSLVRCGHPPTPHERACSQVIIITKHVVGDASNDF